MVTEFDFKEEKSRIFGDILRPVARITLISNDLEVEEYVYVDSGADISLISKSVGELLGFKITEKDKVENIKGIGERSVPMIVKEKVEIYPGFVKAFDDLAYCYYQLKRFKEVEFFYKKSLELEGCPKEIVEKEARKFFAKNGKTR